MQDLETTIKELEDAIAFKKACLSVEFNFGRGNKISESVKTELRAKLKAYCAQLAAGTNSSETPNSSPFSKEEIAALKQLAAAVVAKTTVATNSTTGTQVMNTSAIPEGSVAINSAPKPKFMRGVLLSTENVPKSLRGRVDNGESVELVTKDNLMASVVSKRGVRFAVPLEDIEFEEEI